MDDRKKKNNSRNLNAYSTNAATEIYKTEPESNVPIASDIAVEEAREWVNEGSKL
ncbi:MAG: DUF3787 domain-containing protein [Clostridiaceae bacterium]|nr:DUF3787 domain-containing protein [Clostridiaceae bacterium]